MNHKQITDLFRENEWHQCTSHKIDKWFELQEDYEFGADFGVFSIEAGSCLQFKGKGLNSYLFMFDSPHNHFGYKISLGRSRLLKMKLKEISSIKQTKRT